MKESILKKKSFAFALRIVKLSQYLVEEKKEFVMSKQVLRCGTSVGAMVHEAEYAESQPDFVHKLGVARKEANETHFWISLLKESEYITPKMFDSIVGECEELIKMLTASIKTTKSNL